jgi:hypothetical protein
MQDIPARTNGYFSGMVPDALDPSGFFVTYQDNVGQVMTNSGVTFWKTRNYAQRFGRASASAEWSEGNAINLPGALVRTWGGASGERQYLTSDYVNYSTTDSAGNTQWRSDTRLNLLRATTVRGRAAAELTDTMRFQDRYVGDLMLEGNTLFVNSNPAYYGWYGGVSDARGGVAIGGGGGGGTVDDASDRLTIFDLSKQKFTSVYDEPTGTQGVQLMGTYHGHLFLNLQGDGVLAVDVTNPAHPRGRKFLRTLGWTTHLVFVGDDAYAAAGYFGVYRLNLKDATGLPLVN